MTKVRLCDLNGGSDALFVEVLGGVFEDSPWLVARTAGRRPFADCSELLAALHDAMYGASDEEKLALIRAHPDLAGKAALAGDLTPSSKSEQSGAGLDRLTPDELVVFNQLNADYRAKFGFPFIIAARDNTKASILDAFMRRLENDPSTEVNEALRNIGRIVELRIQDTVAE